MRLVIEDDAGRQVVVPLERDELTIGRHTTNHIRLTQRNISRRHCRFVRAGDVVVLEDLESANGLRVNGAPMIGRHRVAVGDEIHIGDYRIAVEEQTPALPKPAPRD